VLSGNLVSGVTQKPCAVEVTEGHRFSITNNSILDSDGIGLLLSNLTASLVSDNLIRDDRAADKRSKAPSLKIVGGNDNLIGSNLKGNP
jgi:hypothetical protein